MWQSPIVLVTVAALVVAVAIIVLNQKPTGSPGTGDLVSGPVAYSSAQTDGDSLGSATAPVTFEVWSDFQCPICARLVKEQLPTLKTQFVDSGQLRIVSHDIAILGGANQPNESVELAVGGMCAAEQNLYWPYHDLVFWNQVGENQGAYDTAFIDAVADRAGLNRTTFDACFADDANRSAVISATNTAASHGITSTPTLSLNGSTPVAGLPDANALIAAIQQLLSAAPSASASPAS